MKDLWEAARAAAAARSRTASADEPADARKSS